MEAKTSAKKSSALRASHSEACLRFTNGRMEKEEGTNPSASTESALLEVDLLKLQGNHHTERGEHEQAVDLYTKAINLCALNPDHQKQDLAKLYSNRSCAYYGARDLEKAILDADKCIELEKSWSKGYLRKGLALLAARPRTSAKVAETKACYEEGLRNCPGNDELLKALREISRLESVNVFGAMPSTKEAQETVRVKWDEANLERHMHDKGRLYGTMPIDEVETPFLVYDEEMAEKHNLIGTVEKDSSVTAIDMTVLKEKLGLLSTSQDRETPASRVEAATAFEEKRSKHYRDEALQYASATGNPNKREGRPPSHASSATSS